MKRATADEQARQDVFITALLVIASAYAAIGLCYLIPWLLVRGGF